MVSAEYADDDATTRAPMGASGMAVITGNGLKLVGKDASVGITLTSVADASKSFFIPASRVSPQHAQEAAIRAACRHHRGAVDGEGDYAILQQQLSH